MSELDELVQRLKNEMSCQNKSSSWRRFDDTVNAMSVEQRAWVCKQESVIKAENAMMSSFLEYLFNQNREAFVSVQDGKYARLVEDYISEIQKIADGYISRSELLEKENAALKEKLKMLEKKDEPVATNGSGHCRKRNNDNSIRTNSNPRKDSSTLELFEDKSE